MASKTYKVFSVSGKKILISNKKIIAFFDADNETMLTTNNETSIQYKHYEKFFKECNNPENINIVNELDKISICNLLVHYGVNVFKYIEF